MPITAMPTTYLADLKPSQSATILALHIDAELQHRFCALGLRCGQEIHVLRRGWMNGPLHVRVGMTEVMLRRCDARQITVTAVTAVTAIGVAA
jgi:ferrous iron transport protein A